MATQKSSFFLLLISLVLFSLIVPPNSNTVVALHPERLSFDYMFQFGDSLSDTGNLIRDNPIGAHSAFVRFPYGQTLHRPTGRCSDGLLMVDYFARFFHLPLLRPYLDKQGNFSHGVNFAVAGSTALDTSTLRERNIISPVTNSSLSVQLGWFKSYLHSMCSSSNAFECKKRLVGKSLVLMGEVGGNDYNYALLQGMPMEEVYKMVPEVVRAIKDAVKEIINLGAVRVVVPGNFPIGCMPIYLATFEDKDPNEYDELNCLIGLNKFAKFHNDHLQKDIQDLRQEYPEVAIVYGDYYSGLRWILKNANSLGFDPHDLQKTCCGIGNNKYNFNLTRMCGYEGVPVCVNPNQRFSWDGVHLTQHAYLHMAQSLLRQIIPDILQVV